MLEATNTTLADHQARRDDGDRRLRRIARAGRQWKNTIGRPVDMEGAFLFRVAVRVQSGGRLFTDPPACVQLKSQVANNFPHFSVRL